MGGRAISPPKMAPLAITDVHDLLIDIAVVIVLALNGNCQDATHVVFLQPNFSMISLSFDSRCFWMIIR